MRVNRHLELLFGKQTVEKISKTRVLVVGAGGIGCEVLKNLTKSGFRKITIVDLDTIQETNLNRQFYFRKAHIGHSKAHTVKQALLAIDNTLQIKSIHESIYNPNLNESFYRDFDLLISALDSTKARQHLAAQATKNGVPLVDAGTMSYNGQVYATIRFLTSCHNCSPSQGQAPTNVCTIRSRPDRPIHCATYAKHFYESFFGGDLTQSLNQTLKYDRYLPERQQPYHKNDFQVIAEELYYECFDNGISEMDLQGNKIDIVRKLSLKEALESVTIVENPKSSTFNQAEHTKQQKSPFIEDKLLSLHDYAIGFLSSMVRLMERKQRGIALSRFQKDDEDCMELVCCMTNLRTYNFISTISTNNTHKYLTYYQCKDLIGKVFPAIASTNAIAAALELRETINVISGKIDALRYVSISNASDQRLEGAIQSRPNPDCQVCSPKVIYARMTCNMQKTTFRELQDYAAANFFTFRRNVKSGSQIIVRNRGSKTPPPNKDKTISHISELVHNNVLSLTFGAIPNQTPIVVHLSVFDQLGNIKTINTPPKSELRKQLLKYFRSIKKEKIDNWSFEMSLFGGHQI